MGNVVPCIHGLQMGEAGPEVFLPGSVWTPSDVTAGVSGTHHHLLASAATFSPPNLSGLLVSDGETADSIMSSD